MGREGFSLIKSSEGWKRLWVVVSAIWVVVGLIISSVYFYDILVERSYYTPWGGSIIFEVVAATSAVFAPPFLVEPIVKVVLWVVDGFKGGEKNDDEQVYDIESQGEIDRDEQYVCSSEQSSYGGGFHTLSMASDFLDFHPKVKNTILLIPIITFIVSGAGMAIMSIISGPVPELFRPILVFLLVLPVFVVPVFWLGVLVFLIYSYIVRELKLSSLMMAIGFSISAFAFGVVRIIHENLGYFDFGFISYAFSEGIVHNLFAESFGISGLLFAALHLAVCVARENKRNSSSFVSVIIGWSVVGFLINGMYFINI